MAYVDGLLADGERVMRRARQHWFVMVWDAKEAVLALVLALVGAVLWLTVLSSGGLLKDILGWLVLVLLVGGLAWLLWAWFIYRSREFVITNRRIIQTEGLVNKKASDSSLEKINDAVLTESLFGRIFGFGDLEVLTASESGIERLRMLTDAREFKKAMLDAKHELEVDLTRPTMPPMRAEAPAAPTAQPAPPVSADSPHVDSSREVTDAVARLGELRDKGLITPAEFETKKQELLARL
jgi:uncharacterized membrane protein YdbT with pleckstrin-like domain